MTITAIAPDTYTTFIQNKHILPVLGKDETASKIVAEAAFVELARLGYRVEVEELMKFSDQELKDIIDALGATYSARWGRLSKPTYPGFPKQVEEMSTAHLLVEQILHYWTFGAYMPVQDDVDRPQLPIDEYQTPTELTVIDVAEAARGFIESLTTAAIAMSETDAKVLKESVELIEMDLDEAVQVFSKASNFENSHRFIDALRDSESYNVNTLATRLLPLAKTPDHALRIVLSLYVRPNENAGIADEKVAAKVAYDAAVHLEDRKARFMKMNNMPKNVRRILLKRLGEITRGYHADSLVAKPYLWRKVMRMVHPYGLGASILAIDGVKRALDIIHANGEYSNYKTFNSAVEEAIFNRDVEQATQLMVENRPGSLLRRAVSLFRIATDDFDYEGAQALVDGLFEAGKQSSISTIVSAYNGILSANDKNARVTRVAGLNNTLVDREGIVDIDEEFIEAGCKALLAALREKLTEVEAPTSPAGVADDNFISLVERDLSENDSQLTRGQKVKISGEGNTLRFFSFWKNTFKKSGFIDLGVVILDDNFETLSVLTWDTWDRVRDWGIYSGDKCVSPKDSAAEYFDVKLGSIRNAHPDAKYAAITLQSWSGFPFKDVDMVAGVMLRQEPDSGEVFEPRTVVAAGKPSTASLQSVPMLIDLDSREMIWVDTSNGSTAERVSSGRDKTIGALIYDELYRPRLRYSDFVRVWADAHGVEVDENSSYDEKEILNLMK